MGFSGGRKGQESGYAPGEREDGLTSVEERKVRSQDTPLGRKDGLTSVEERKVRSQDTPLGRKDGLPKAQE